MKNKKEIIVFIIFLMIFVITLTLVNCIGNISLFEVKIIHIVQSIFKALPLKIPLFLTDFWYSNIIIIMAVVSIIFLINKKYKEAIIYILSVPIAKFVYTTIKLFVARQRPPLELRLTEVSSYSFPSGHSIMSMILFGMMLYFSYKFIKNKILKTVVISILSLIILTIGITRLWLGVHFPTDVIGGYSLGICLICLFVLVDKIDFTKIKNK